MTGFPWIDLALGLVVLGLGAEWLVRGSSRLAVALGVPPLIVGLTVVAFGTSAPELVVSLTATLGGKPDVALGNVVGSNNFNILLILGACALLAPLKVDQKLVRLEVPVLTLISAGVWWAARDGWIGRLEGSCLLLGLGLYTAWCVRSARREPKAVVLEYAQAVPQEERRNLPRDLGWIAIGLAALILGSKAFVGAAILIARGYGVSDLVISLTVVAAGTSLPEVATSVLATLRGQRDIAVGNVIGSNLFNLLGVLGAAAVASPVRVASEALSFDLPVMAASALCCWPIFASGHKIDRLEGSLLLLGFACLTALQIAGARDPAGALQWARIGLPLALVGLSALLWLLARRARGLAR